MSLICITGIAGAGKSAVCEELVRRGYEAHEADDKLSAFYNNETGGLVKNSVADMTPEWRTKHSWKMSKDALLALKSKAEGKPVFICGVAANEEEYIDIFDKIFALDIDVETMQHRIATRTNNDFGKTKEVMKELLEWHQTTEAYYEKIEAHIINAAKPLNAVVDEILALTITP